MLLYWILAAQLQLYWKIVGQVGSERNITDLIFLLKLLFLVTLFLFFVGFHYKNYKSPAAGYNGNNH